MEKVLLSIVVPVYNVAPYLKECVESILSQTYTDYELILVDDGSTDGSGALCDALAETDRRILTMHQKNQGLSAARNTGIRLSRGLYIALIDSDDLIGTPTTLAMNMAIANAHPEVDVVQFPIRRFSKLGDDEEVDVHNVTQEVTFCDRDILSAYLKRVISVSVWNKIFHCRVFEIAMFPEGRVFEDAWFMADALPHIHKVICSPYGYYKYRCRPGSILQSRFSEQKSVQYIENFVKTQKLYCSISTDNINYIESYQCTLSYLVRFCSTYGRTPYVSLLPRLDAQCPSMKIIVKYSARLALRDFLRLLVVRLVGVKKYLKLVFIVHPQKKFNED